LRRKTLEIGERPRRRERVQAVRRRPRHAWRRTALLGAAAILLAGGLFAGGRWLMTDSLFSLGRVATGPYRYTSRPALENILRTALGANIWSFPAEALADSIEVLPWVQDARVGRRLPATVKVQLREWRPVLEVIPTSGAAGREGESLVLLENGTVVAFPADLTLPGLPVLTGVSLQEVGPAVWRPQNIPVASLLELVAAIDRTGLEAACPVDFLLPLDQDRGFAVVLQGDRGRLLVGREDFAARLQRYLAARDQLATGLEVDLRFRNRISTVKLRQRA